MAQPTITPDSVIARAGDLLAAQVDDETVLLALEQQSYYALAATAQEIWQQIAHPVRVDELCTALVRRYTVDPKVCAEQTVRFLDNLCQEGLVQVIEAPAA